MSVRKRRLVEIIGAFLSRISLASRVRTIFIFSDAPVSCLMRALVPMWFRHASLAPLRPALCAAPSANPLAVAIAPLIDSDADSALLPPARFIKLAVFCATSAGSAVDSALVNLPVQKSFDSFLELAVQLANVAVEQVRACLLSNSPCVGASSLYLSTCRVLPCPL